MRSIIIVSCIAVSFASCGQGAVRSCYQGSAGGGVRCVTTNTLDGVNRDVDGDGRVDTFVCANGERDSRHHCASHDALSGPGKHDSDDDEVRSYKACGGSPILGGDDDHDDDGVPDERDCDCGAGTGGAAVPASSGRLGSGVLLP